MNKFFPLFLFLLSFSSYGKVLDKVVGVINDNVYTLSEVKRIKSTVAIRKEIAPYIYKNSSYTESEILKILQERYVIKDKLSELGFIISDDAVESRIKETEKGLRLNREELLKFLSSKGLTFNEYFELLRQAMEFSVFQRRIIGPLVTITDQELKNFYYKRTKNKKALSFKYKVIDFTLPAKTLARKEDQKRLPKILEKYRNTGNIPAIYSKVETTDMGAVSDDDLPKDLSSLLKDTDEKSFSKVYIKGGVAHSFYLIEKDLVESSEFLKNKNFIKNEIFMERSDKIAASWLNREILNYYILNNL